MRQKKPSISKDTSTLHSQHKGKSKHKEAKQTHLHKRKDESNFNKQNIIQITEPMEPTEQVYSKELMLSMDSFNRNKAVLEDTTNTVHSVIHPATNSSKSYEEQGSQFVFNRRLSLKRTSNGNSERGERTSMLPIRRDSIGTFSGSHPEERQSVSSFLHRSSQQGQHLKSICPDIKKDAIITNLVSKLGHEEDLRNIIESKLRYRNQTYLADSSDQHSKMSAKLKDCEGQIRHFKSIIRQMSEKISNLSNSKQQLSRASYSKEQNFQSTTIPACQCLCQKSSHSKKMTKQVGIQTINKDKLLSQKRDQEDRSGEFMQNLEKTLKMLQVKKRSCEE